MIRTSFFLSGVNKDLGLTGKRHGRASRWVRIKTTLLSSIVVNKVHNCIIEWERGGWKGGDRETGAALLSTWACLAWHHIDPTKYKMSLLQALVADMTSTAILPPRVIRERPGRFSASQEDGGVWCACTYTTGWGGHHDLDPLHPGAMKEPSEHWRLAALSMLSISRTPPKPSR